MTQKLSEFISSRLHTFSDLVPERGQEKFRALLKEGFIKLCFPRIKKSLFEDRSLVGKVLVAPLEALRRGADAALEYASTSITDSLAQDYLSFLPPEQLEELRKAAIAGNLEAAIQKSLEQFFWKASLYDARPSASEVCFLDL